MSSFGKDGSRAFSPKILVKMSPSLGPFRPRMMPSIFYCFVEYFHLWIALWVSCKGFSVRYVHELHHFCWEFIRKFFSAVIWIWARITNLQNHSLKIAFLFWIDVTTEYLVNASVMHNTNFLLLLAVNIGPNRSAWILQWGHSGISSGDSGVGFIGDFYLCWQVRHVCTCILISW